MCGARDATKSGPAAGSSEAWLTSDRSAAAWCAGSFAWPNSSATFEKAVACRQLAVGPEELRRAQLARAQGDERGRDVGQSFVHRETLRRQRVVQVAREAVEDRVAGLVRDNIPRQAEEDVAPVGRELEELQAPRRALVERVRLDARAREDEQLRSVEAPRDRPAQHLLVLEHAHRARGTTPNALIARKASDVIASGPAGRS